MVPNGGTYAAKFLPKPLNQASSENLVTTTGKYSSSAKYVLAVDYIPPKGVIQKYDIISPHEGCFKKQFLSNIVFLISLLLSFQTSLFCKPTPKYFAGKFEEIEEKAVCFWTTFDVMT